MDRPVRRSRQRVPATGLIGLLPQEEAAINRALHESLLEGKKKSPKNKESELTCSHISLDSCSSSLSTRAIYSAGTSTYVMGLETQDPVEGSSKSKARRGTGRLQSPLSPSQSLDSSSESKPSSPTYASITGISSSSVSSPLSVESSLKLVLSTSSWSSSSSPSWSPSPEPLNSAKVAEKSQSKIKGIMRVETKQKGKRGRPRKYPPKANKAPSKISNTTSKVPKTYTKAALQAHAVSSTKQHKVKKTGVKGKKPKKGESLQWSSELDMAPMSPEAALVLHDHCYSSDCKALNSRAPGAKCSNKSSLYPVQRKFAQNQVPAITPTRPSAEEVENMSSLKEVPKTEDFITFLCLRGSKTMPKELEKFAVPWTRFQRKRPKNGLEVRRKTLTFAMKGSKLRSRNVARKLGESISSAPALGLS